MHITPDFWLSDVQQVPSPYFDARPEHAPVSLLVVHNISLPPGQYGGPYVEQFFTGTLDPNEHPFFKVIHKMGVSAHCFIRRDGEIIQFVPFNARAWHAGKSSFAGVERCNDYSIGIELEGTDLDSYTQAQYDSLVKVTLLIMQSYPDISLPRITGHQYIAPLRKTDPGLGFDWRYFRSLLNEPQS